MLAFVPTEPTAKPQKSVQLQALMAMGLISSQVKALTSNVRKNSLMNAAVTQKK